MSKPTKPVKSKRRRDILKGASWLLVDTMDKGQIIPRYILAKPVTVKASKDTTFREAFDKVIGDPEAENALIHETYVAPAAREYRRCVAAKRSKPVRA